ncbi:MAG: hypothetical protein ACE5HX_04935 [bacterium]
MADRGAVPTKIVISVHNFINDELFYLLALVGIRSSYFNLIVAVPRNVNIENVIKGGLK